MPSARALSIFQSPSIISAWRAESRRVANTCAQQHQPALPLVDRGLELLDELVCQGNPQHHNPLHVRAAIYEVFSEAASYGYPLGLCFAGLSEIEGHGCARNVTFGNAKVKVAASWGCGEALNYLALCSLRRDLTGALRMLHAAALANHPQGLKNYKILATHVQRMLRAQSKVVEFPGVAYLSSRPSIR